MAQINHVFLRRKFTIVQVQAEGVVVFQQTHYRYEIGNAPQPLCEGFYLRFDSADYSVVLAEEHVLLAASFQGGLESPPGVPLSSKQKRTRNPSRRMALT